MATSSRSPRRPAARPTSASAGSKSRPKSHARPHAKSKSKTAARSGAKFRAPARTPAGKPARSKPGRGKPGRGKAIVAPAKPTRPAKVARTPALIALEKLALTALDDMKAVNVKVMDVRGLTDVADTMIVASGNSDRHVRAIAERVIEQAKAAGRRPLGTEGKQDCEWVLVDLQDVLVHVMLPRVREFYALEQLWEAPVAARQVAAQQAPRAKAR